MRAVMFTGILLGLLRAGSVSAGMHFVKPDGTGDFPTLQAALHAAAPGDTIELDDGTFTGPGNRDLSFEGKALRVRSRSNHAEVCIIDCGGGIEPHRGFVMQTEGPGSILEAVTITGGCLTQPEVLGDGGAIWCGGASAPSIRSCVFRQNQAQRGGALYCDEAARPVIEHCRFTGNAATRGGAVAAVGISDPTFRYCTFDENQAELEGAAIDCAGQSMTIEYATIADNVLAAAGSAVALAAPLPVTMRNAIVAFSRGAAAVAGTGGLVALSCCDLYGNEGGDWIGSIAGQLGMQGNINLDPMFCRDLNPEAAYTLFNDSPCSEMENPQCGRIGAWGLGCGLPEAVAPGEAAGGAGLGRAQPNPFRHETVITYRGPGSGAPASLSASIFDAAGHAIRALVPEARDAGGGVLRWDGCDARGTRMPAGVYFCRLRAGAVSSTRALLRVR